MLKVKYAGPEVNISQHGISYQKDREDKYVYLLVAIEILKNIDNDYDKQTSYSHCCASHELEESDIHTILQSYEKELEIHVQDEYESYETKIKDELEAVNELTHLSTIDKEIWMKNIEIMKSYSLQRAINQIYYEHSIRNIKKLMITKKIKELSTPFNKDFFYVMHSLKNILTTGKPVFVVNLDEETNKENVMCIKLNIK